MCISFSIGSCGLSCRRVNTICTFSAGIGAAILVVSYIRVALWLITSYRQTYCIRVALLQAVLRQEIGWFDTHDAGELGSRLAESVLILCFNYDDKIYFQ